MRFGELQNDASDLVDALLLNLHQELVEPFMYEADLYVLGDTQKQIAHAAKQHWALHLSNRHFSQVKDIFYYQIVWDYKCLSCNGIVHMFEINSIFKVRMRPEFTKKRYKIRELIELTLRKFILSMKLLTPNDLIQALLMTNLKAAVLHARLKTAL